MSDGASDLDEEINNATISFVPQVGNGGGGRKRKKERSIPESNNTSSSPTGASAMPGFADMNTIHQHSSPPQGYGSPPPPLPPPPPPQSYQNHYQQDPGYYNQPNPAYSPNNNLAQPMLGQPVMMGSPIMMGSPHGNNTNYPQASAYMPGSPSLANQFAPGQPGAMILLVQESRDPDFRAPLFGFTSCMSCMNSFFLPYCMLARQHNMLRETPMSAYRNGQAGGRYVSDVNASEAASRKVTSYNSCCVFALLFDVGRAAAVYFVPGLVASIYLVNGLCIQTLQLRQQVRARFGIASSQCGDFGVSCCCAPCSISQMYEEMKLRGSNHRLVAGDDGKCYPSVMR